MNWKPKTEEEVQAAELCPVGMQPFTVLEATEGKSKKRADMLKLKLNVHADDGFDYHVYDHISHAFLEYKFRHFFFAIGCGAQYEAGTVDPARLVGREGYAEVKHEKGKDGFGPKAAIADYIVKSEKAEPAPAKKEVEPDGAVPAPAPEEDDIPF